MADRRQKTTPEERAVQRSAGVSRALLSQRLKAGWPREKALSTPPFGELDGVTSRQFRFVVGHDERDDDGAWRCAKAPREHTAVSAFARSHGVDSGTLFARIRSGFPTAIALTVAKHSSAKFKHKIGVDPAVDVAREHGVPRGTLYNRITAGWSLDDAATRPVGEPKSRR